MAAAAGDTLVGPLGQTGVLFLARAAPNLAQRRQKVLALCQKARDLAGGFGMQACAAVGPFGSYQTLPRRVVACRTAAEQALLTNTPILDAKEGGSLLRAQSELGELARAIVDAIERHPERVELIVDRYLEVVALRSAFRPEVAFAYVDCLINDLLRVVTRAVGATRRALESALRELQRQDAATLSDVLARAREALLDLAAAVRQPLQADRELRLRRAEDYVLSRFTEHVTMPAAARAAGYAPAYFSRLFKQQYGTTFERYLLDLRLDRARELLRNTDVSIERVAQSSGFRSLDYFFHVFRARTGMAPGAYRRSSTANGSPQID
jgi:AraC-like DNA-binding protein